MSPIFIGEKASLDISNSKFTDNRTCMILTESAKITSLGNRFENSLDSSILWAKDNTVFRSEKDEFTGNCKSGANLYGHTQFYANQTKFTNFYQQDSKAIFVHENAKMEIIQNEFKLISDIDNNL